MSAAPGPLRVPLLGVPVRRRGALVAAGTALAAAVVALLALGTGDYPLSPGQVVAAVLDPGAGFARTVVLEWRMPRVVAALALGAGLGLAGALFQSLTRNPLGSPDVIGFTAGSYTGALLVLTAGGASFAAAAGGALTGGLATALVVYLLAWRGGAHGGRLVLVGIAATAALQSVNTYLLLRSSTEVAMQASIWGAGSISLVGWDRALPAAAALAVLAVVVLALSGPLRQLELGDDAASAHGLATERSRLAVVVVGVALTAVATAAAGPIAFVALAAPQLARRLARSAGLPLVSSAMTGALLLLVADAVAQRLPGGAVPVGVVTAVGGGVYLVVLLALEARGRR